MTNLKTILRSTSMLVASCAVMVSASDAQAAEKAKKMSLGISGSFKSVLAFGKQDASYESTASSTSRTGYDAFSIWNNSEVHLKGSTKLDNGITVDVIIQLETDQSTAGGGQTSNAANASSNNSIDESYVRLHGGFGDLRMGSTKNASNVMATMAPSVGITSSNDGDASNVIIKPSSVSVGTDTLLGTSDDMKIAYYTPVFSGFQVGASLTPSNSEADTMPAVGGTAGTDTQEYNIALGYLSKLGGVDVSADVSYSEIHGEVASSSKGWRAGINLGFGNVVVGGSYRDTSELDSLVAGTSSSPEETSFDAGITYSSGPWAVGINYLSVSAPLATSTPGDDAATQIFLGASYSLGPGVDLLGNVFRATWEDESSADSANNDGWGALAGISVSF